jgi:hypothetical protein
MVHQNGCAKVNDNVNAELGLKLLRGASELAQFGNSSAYTGTLIYNFIGSVSIAYLDSPATTSSTTYKTTFANAGAAGTARVQAQSSVSTITLMEIGA